MLPSEMVTFSHVSFQLLKGIPPFHMWLSELKEGFPLLLAVSVDYGLNGSWNLQGILYDYYVIFR